jgi:hypothetical protein
VSHALARITASRHPLPYHGAVSALAGEEVRNLTRFGFLLWRSPVLLWTAFTVVFLAVISILIVREPNFPLGITFVDTRGLAGLWITVPSFLLGLFGLLLLLFRRATGAKWLHLYSAFWTASSFYGAVEKFRTVIHQPLAVCLTGMCATLPVTLAILLAFVLCVFWFWRQSYPRAV